jgi:hypothetical protein
VAPVEADAAGFADGAAHRAKLPPAYQRYSATGPDPFYSPETEAMQMLLRPLFLTSFLIDDQLDDDGLTGRGPVLISSASSKTAIGVAHLLARREGGETVALTSPGNAELVAGLGIYDRVVPYGEIDSLEPGPATYVDVSGNGEVRRAVHERFGAELLHSMAVGVTHWEDFGSGGGGELPGPPPTLFFAPDRVVKRGEDWGGAGLMQRTADAWHPFCEWIGGWLETVPGEGLTGARDAYLEVIEGRVAPDAAHVISLTR